MIHKDSYTYLLCGDSISKGIVYDEVKNKYIVSEHGFPFILQDKLKGVICNASRFGNTLIKAANRLQKDILKNKPDIVLIEFGGNDCDFDWEEIACNPYGEHKPRTDFHTFETLLKNFIKSLKNARVIPVLMNLPPIDADRYFKWISRNSSVAGDKILTWLGSVGKIYWWQERYNSLILSVAQETKTRLIDIRGAFLKYPDFRKFICVDGIHPNEEGHKIIAGRIIEYIRSNYVFLLNEF
ncbi:MAG: SGNH/GDSL hydrolase family protein [Acetivibrionales bacterium]